MKVTKVDISLVTKPGICRAMVNITLDDAFIVNGIRILEKKSGGLYIRFPEREVEGRFRGIAYPRTAELTEKFTEQILEEYELRLMEKQELESEMDDAFMDMGTEPDPKSENPDESEDQEHASSQTEGRTKKGKAR